MRYYFGITENGRVLTDDEGDDLTNDVEARSALCQLLAEQAQGLLRDHDTGEMIVTVRDNVGIRFRGTLSMNVD